MRLFDIHIKAISQLVSRLLFCIMNMKIILLKLQPHFPGSNVLTFSPGYQEAKTHYHFAYKISWHSQFCGQVSYWNLRLYSFWKPSPHESPRLSNSFLTYKQLDQSGMTINYSPHHSKNLALIIQIYIYIYKQFSYFKLTPIDQIPEAVSI